MRSLLILLLSSTAIAATLIPAQFSARRDYLFTHGAFLVRSADVNGDKIPDLVAIDTSGNTIPTLLGQGNGTFSLGPTSQPGFQVMSGMALTDLNGDGVIDLVVAGQANNGANGIGVCFGNGDGTFQAAVFYQVSDARLDSVVMEDFNGDGIPDVATVGNDGVWLFLGKGGGVFSPGVLTPTRYGFMPSLIAGRLAAADFNGDGHLDLAVNFNSLDFGTPSGFALLLGNGDGTFQTPVNHVVLPATAENYIQVADLNRDGHPDIVLSPIGVSASYVNVLLNNGKAQFSAPIQVTMNAAVEVAIGDLNGDGIPDIVNSLGTVVFGKGNGQFGAPVSYAVENCQFSTDVTLAPLFKEGVLDIVAAQQQAVSVLLNEGSRGIFEDGEWISVPGAGSCAAAADYNRDGKPDLAVPTSNGILIMLGTGTASAPYTTGVTIPLSGPGCPIAGDLNGDGIPDILVGANSLGGVGAYLGNGDGTFTLASITAAGPGMLVLGDFNHDGKLDFADSTNQLALGNGDGTFQAPSNIISNPPALGFNWIAAGDVNNDGWTDLVLTPADYFDYFTVLLNNQRGGFTESTIEDQDATIGVVLADLNLDGNLDAVIWPVFGGAQIYLGNGKGGFTLQSQTPAYPGLDTIMLAIGDVNGDGIPDLLLPADGSLGIAYGIGNGTFEPTVAWGVGASPGQILLENLHGQPASAHRPDIVSPDSGGGVTVLLNLAK
jgi:hypothetical protein